MRQFAVIGLGNFGRSVALSLAEKGGQVLAIDKDEERIQDISEKVTYAVKADASDEKVLKSLDIKNVDVAIVSVGESMETSIMVSLLLREMGVKMIVTKAISSLHGKVLRKIGVDRVIFPERDIGAKVAESLISPNIYEYIELSPDYSIVELVSPKSFAGKSLKSLDVRKQYKVTIIAIKRKTPEVNDSGETQFKEDINVTPFPEDEIESGDVLVVVGADKDINKFRGVE
ncbi:MAG: TrkA family potassium uptake protein [bacterium]|nr:TrkA family potassium uptake protein [bacterium]MDD5353673.1 TrkA family potassium uptake protein [bacterium]MDD5756581.1 TrkA family potassium uptake protein [bacterium]